jgi:hypothetical protein
LLARELLNESLVIFLSQEIHPLNPLLILLATPVADQETHQHRGGAQRALRSSVALVLVAIILGGAYLVFDLNNERPNFYQPARGAITDAAMILSETYNSEKDLIEKYQSVHKQLESAIALLDKAEKLDPDDQRQIETLQIRLRALENGERMLTTQPDELKRTYHELIEQMHTLAHQLEQSAASK